MAITVQKVMGMLKKSSISTSAFYASDEHTAYCQMWNQAKDCVRVMWRPGRNTYSTVFAGEQLSSFLLVLPRLKEVLINHDLHARIYRQIEEQSREEHDRYMLVCMESPNVVPDFSSSYKEVTTEEIVLHVAEDALARNDRNLKIVKKQIEDALEPLEKRRKALEQRGTELRVQLGRAQYSLMLKQTPCKTEAQLDHIQVCAECRLHFVSGLRDKPCANYPAG